MAKFNFQGNPVLTDEEFNEMASNDKQLRELRYPCGYQHVPSKETRHYIEYKYNECRDITAEQIEKATRIYEQRRNEIRKSIKPGTLFIVTMGMDYETNTPEGLGNYRVRAQYRDQSGDVCGCEFSVLERRGSTPDESKGFTFDRWNNSREEREMKEYAEKTEILLKKYRHFWSIPISERPLYPASYADRGICRDMEYTISGVITWMKRECVLTFTDVYIDRYFFNCDEVISEPVK